MSHYKQYTAAHKKYEKSAKGKAARKKYMDSDKGRAARKAAMKRRNERIREALAAMKAEAEDA